MFNIEVEVFPLEPHLKVVTATFSGLTVRDVEGS